MSLESELGLTDENLKECARPLQERILGTYAKIKGLELVRNNQTAKHHSHYLLSKAKAVRKLQGLDMADPPDDEIIFGNKTITNSLVPAVAILAGAALIAGVLLWMSTLSKEPPAPVDPTKPPAVVPGYDIESVIKPSFGEQA